MSDSKRIFSEKEATDLMIRAAKLQEEEPDSDSVDYVPGITFEELARMAKELGVEERYLAKAIDSEVVFQAEVAEKQRKGFLGVDFVREYETIIDGELPPTHFDVVLEDLGVGMAGPRTGYAAGTTQIGRTVKGQLSAGLGLGAFTMTSRHGRTRLNVRSNAFVPFMSIAYPMSIFSIVIGAIIGDKGFAPAWIVMLFIIGGIALGLTIAGMLAQVGHRKLKEKFDKIVEKVEAETSLLRENLNVSTDSMNSQNSDSIEHRLTD